MHLSEVFYIIIFKTLPLKLDPYLEIDHSINSMLKEHSQSANTTQNISNVF